MNRNLDDYTDDERRLFEVLSKTAAADPLLEDRIVHELRQEGLLGRRLGSRVSALTVLLAAGLALAAWFGGVRYGARDAKASSIEGMLARTDLSSADRILLMQRAGSAYVTASNLYASGVKTTDSAAVEVSSQVLIGAAQAAARARLDAPLSLRIATMVRESNRASTNTHPVIWY